MLILFFSKEQLVAAMKKKKECNAKAQKVVEKLLDHIEDEAELLLMVKIRELLTISSLPNSLILQFVASGHKSMSL